MVDVRQTYLSAREEAMMDEARVEFRGKVGDPIEYEDIVLSRDVVFVTWDRHYDEEQRSWGAPVSETFCYTGIIRERRGANFDFTCFSCVAPEKLMRRDSGNGWLAGGEGGLVLTLDKHMKFWKTGELYIAKP